MHRLLQVTAVVCLGTALGCSGAAQPNPEDYVQELLKAINDYAAELDKVAQQAKSTSAADFDKLLDKSADVLDKMDTAMTDISEKIKRSALTAAQRKVYNTAERRREIENLQDRLPQIVGQVADALNREGLNPKSVAKFRQSWERLRDRAAALHTDLAKSLAG